VNALVMGQIFYLLNSRFFSAPALSAEGIFGNRIALVAIAACLGLQLLLTYAPFMNLMFDTAPLDAAGWLYCVAVGIGVFVVIEAEKALIRAGRHPFLASAGPARGGDDTQQAEG
jgi:magnesium-transporting ATPase (P-type)